MATNRKIGSAKSGKRALILAATEQVMVEQGYAAVTSRRVAAVAGIPAPLVHYYFPTLDDLFVALLRRGADRNVERMNEALASEQPLLEVWGLIIHTRAIRLLDELMVAANHREALRLEVRKLAELARVNLIDGLRTLMPEYGLDAETFPPELLASALQGVALLLAREQNLGLATRPEVAAGAVTALLSGLEDRRSGPVRRSSRKTTAAPD